MTAFGFDVIGRSGAARAGVFRTPHGSVETPAFMPVGTLGTVKALDPEDLIRARAQMILANTYHLHLRPGDDIVRDLGGLHRFMAWSGPILTDSGGFQVFSLESLRRVDEDGVEFRSHIDGSSRRFTPERVINIQRNLGADVIMQFDHVIPGQADLAAAHDASERSVRWLERCLAEFLSERPRTTDHVPAGNEESGSPTSDSRRPCFRSSRRHPPAAARHGAGHPSMHDWPGFAIGGLSVGESAGHVRDA